MKIPEKKLKCGFGMPALGLGTWQMGGREERDVKDDGSESERALREGLALGYTLIDTAEMYAGGYAEEIVGRAIEGFPREKLFLTSKVWKTHLHYDDVLRSLEDSLKRLKTDYLDLYLIHQVEPSVPLSETVRALNRLVDEKLIRHIGVSNFSRERLEGAQVFADSKVVVDQVHYNLKVRETEGSGLLEYCQANDIMITAWRPLQKGMLPEAGEKILAPLSEKYGVPVSTVALAWLLSQENLTTITMSRDPDHLAENMAAADLKLTEEEVEMLRREFPEQVKISDAVPLI